MAVTPEIMTIVSRNTLSLQENIKFSQIRTKFTTKIIVVISKIRQPSTIEIQ